MLEQSKPPKDTPSETACGHRIVASRSGLYDRPCPYTKDHAVHTDPNISSYHEWTPRATVQAQGRVQPTDEQILTLCKVFLAGIYGGSDHKPNERAIDAMRSAVECAFNAG